MLYFVCFICFVFLFHNYKFKLPSLCLKNKTTCSFHIICNLVSFEETGELSAKSKIYTMNGAGLGLLVLRGDNSILDKVKSAGGAMKRSP